MDNIILKVTYGEIFGFFDSDTKNEFVIGTKRSCDLVLKAAFATPEQIRCIRRDGVWYAEDMTPEGSKSEVLMNGKRFKRPIVRLDDEITVRKIGDKKSGDVVRITPVRKISRRRTGDKLDLTKKTMTVVGRNPSCDLVLDNPMVSEKHFRIVYDGKRCFIEDLHSINGTYVNNRKVRRAELKDYDRISIPSAAYVFYEKKLLYSTSAAGIQVDCVGVRKEVSDRAGKGKICIVNNVSFRIEAGDFVAIVGGSGAGKSTLLDCMNGLRPATEGEIYYDTNNYYENIRSYKDLMGYVPQRDIMHDDLPLAEGLYYTALLRMRTSMLKDEVKNRVREAIADVRLTGSEGVRISSLSGGQRKRASIAMELLADPKVIFLDEPTSGLSPDLDLEMMELLRDLSRKGRTIVVITHAMENLDKCDKVAFLGKGGRMCFYGEHSDIFRYFNRRSYSRIFAALADEKNSEFYERKYRSTEYYKKLHREFVSTYGGLTDTLLPPVARAEINGATEGQTAENGETETPENGAKHLFGKRSRAVKDAAGATSPRRRRKDAAPEPEEEKPSATDNDAAESAQARDDAPAETADGVCAKDEAQSAETTNTSETGNAVPSPSQETPQTEARDDARPTPETSDDATAATTPAPRKRAKKTGKFGFDVIPEFTAGGDEFVVTFADGDAAETVKADFAETATADTETEVKGDSDKARETRPRGRRKTAARGGENAAEKPDDNAEKREDEE